MAEKNIGDVKSIKSEEELTLKEVNLLQSKDHVINSEKNEVKVQNPMSNINGIKTEEKEKVIKSNNDVLKRKVTKDGVKIERVLFEGEASSDFETILSLDSKGDIKDFDLCSSINGDDFNVIVQIKNELAFQNQQKSVGRIIYKKDRSYSLCRYKNRSEHFSDDYKSQQNKGFQNFLEQKYRQNNKCITINDKNDRKHKNSDKSEEFIHSRQDSPVNQERSRSGSKIRNLRKRSRWSRKNDHDNRSRHSWSSEITERSQSSRSLERNIRSKNPSCKDRKTEARSSEGFDNNSAKSNIKRKRAPRKRTRRSRASSLWNSLPPEGVEKKISVSYKTVRDSLSSLSRKKESIPFLMELEKKLKETESLKNFSEEPVTVPIPKHSSYPAMPMFSVDNLPLVPGPTGLPVHITITGEQILHDMEGRRIPIGPNGHYLPLDPTGCLFPHIISPGNQAVPIHMTEDGVLRLPNSEPIPYGPGHQFPVHIDGSIIFIGPDSKPLYPCSNLPKEPPPLLQMMETSSAEHVAAQQVTPVISQIPQVRNQQNFEVEPQQTQSTIQTNIQPSRTDHGLLEFLQNSSEKISKLDLMKKYKHNVRERNEDALVCLKTKKTFSSNPSKIKTNKFIPIKLLQKNTFRDDSCSYSSDIVLDSGDSDSVSSLKCIPGSKKGAAEEIVLSSDDDRNVLKIISDSKNQKKQNKEDKREDRIIKKIHRALKTLREKNYKPPVFGRFIITSLMANPLPKVSPNESPILRNRIQLPFLTPKAKDVSIKDQPATTENTAVTFKFLPQKKSFEKEEMHLDFKRNKISNENCEVIKFPVFTADFSMQCDFTSLTMKNLSSKISDLEREVVRLKKVNGDLFDGYKSVQAMNQKKNDQLRKFTLEIEEKDSEIQKLKRMLEKRQ